MEIPDDIFRYILMARAKITRDSSGETRVEFWRRWLAEKKAAADVGHAASRRLQKLITERIANVETENAALRRRMESYDLPSALRLTIGTAEANRAVIAALREFLA